MNNECALLFQGKNTSVEIHPVERDGEVVWEGIEMEIINILAHKYNFTLVHKFYCFIETPSLFINQIKVYNPMALQL